MEFVETLVVEITIEANDEEDLDGARASVEQLIEFLNCATPMVVQMKTT